MNTHIPQRTADGSFTFFSSEFSEAFHSQYGARQEAEYKFIEPTHLAQKAHQPVLKLLDVCYGLGYNAGVALATIWSVNPHCQIQLVGLEADPAIAVAAVKQGFFSAWPQPVQEVLAALANDHHVQSDRLEAQILIGDARQTIQHVDLHCADAVFLDPFSPPRCPQLWTLEFLTQVVRCLAPTGRLATYSCAAAVRAALCEAGCHIGSTQPVGRRSPGTVASLSLDLPPLSRQEQEHLLTRAAIPYRDPSLNDAPALILQRRRLEQQASDLEQTSQWKKRWFTAE